MSRVLPNHIAESPAPAAGEPCAVFTVAEVRANFFPGRCARWIKATFKPGTFGPVFFDGACWFISAQAIAGWQRAHRVGPAEKSERGFFQIS